MGAWKVGFLRPLTYTFLVTAPWLQADCPALPVALLLQCSVWWSDMHMSPKACELRRFTILPPHMATWLSSGYS